jgi:hypothetical protein
MVEEADDDAPVSVSVTKLLRRGRRGERKGE